MSTEIKAVLVSLSVTQWARNITDKAKTKQVLEDEHAADDAGKWRKNLLPGSAFTSHDGVKETTVIDQLAGIAAKSRQLHYELTLPWEKPWAILPAQSADKYRTDMTEAQRIFNEMVGLLPQVWSGYIGKARATQNGMFNEDDYPSIDKLIRKYSFAFQFAPLPQTGHFITALAQESLTAMRTQLENRNQALLEQATARLKDDMLAPMQEFVERLADPKNRRFGGLLEHIDKMCNRANTLNLTNNPEIAQQIAMIKSLVNNLTPEALQNAELAGSVRTVGQQIVAHFGQMGQRRFAV